jgi:hypothetical protein
LLVNRATARLRWYAKRTVHRLDNPELASARRLLKRMRVDPPDVLWLGDSTTIFLAPGDRDRRRLADVVADELGPSVSMHVISGAGYHSGLHRAYLELLRGQPGRPVILHSLWVRGRFQPWIHHPTYGHEAVLPRVQALDHSTAPWQVWASIPRPGRDAFARHAQMPHTTLRGPGRVADYVDPLRGSGLDPQQRIEMMNMFHHGARLEPDTPSLGPVTALGRSARELGRGTVAYYNPVCIERGVEVLGTEFRPHVLRNHAILEAAYRAGAGPEATVLSYLPEFVKAEFMDPELADEHLGERGRRRLGREIAEAVTEKLAEPDPPQSVRVPAGQSGESPVGD